MSTRHSRMSTARVACYDEAVVARVTCCSDVVVATAATTVESTRTLMTHVDEAFVYEHLEHAREAAAAHALSAAATVARVDLDATAGSSVLADNVLEEQRNSQAYALFKDMVDAEPDLDPSF